MTEIDIYTLKNQAPRFLFYDLAKYCKTNLCPFTEDILFKNAWEREGEYIVHGIIMVV